MALFSELDSSLELDYSSFVSGLGEASGAARTFGSTTEDALDDADDEMDSTARSASGLSRAMGTLGGAAGAAVGPINIFTSSVDEAGDEASEAGMEAAGAATGFAALSASGEGLRLSLGAISGNLTTVAVGITAVMAALSPLVPVLGLAAGAVMGLGAAFAAIIGTGLVAYNDKLTSSNKKRLKTVQSKIKALEKAKEGEKELSAAQKEQLATLKEQEKELKKSTEGFGALGAKLKEVGAELRPVISQFGQKFIHLIESAIQALPGFVKGLLNAVGNLKPFVSALEALGGAAADILPKLLKLFVDVARQALPVFHDIGNFIAANLVPALDSLFQAGQRAAGPVLRLGLAIADLVTALSPVFGLLARAALSLYDIAAGAVRAGAALTTGFINGLRRGIGVLSEWGALIGAMVIPIIQRMASAWANTGGRVSSVASSMTEAIQGRLGMAMQSVANTVLVLLGKMMGAWVAHGARVESVINQFSTHATEAVIQMMAAISTAMQGAGEGEASFGFFFKQGLQEMLAAARVIGRQLPQPIRSAMALIAGAVRTNIAQVRTQIAAARGIWIQHGAAVRQFATQAITALRQFGAMVRTAIAQPLATFARLRTELNQMLPPFLRIKTTARELGTAIKTQLLPALAATGLLGIATTLAPLLSGPLLGAFTRLSGVGVRLAALFGGPLVSGFAMLVSPVTRLGALIAGTLLPALAGLATTVGGVLLGALTSIATIAGGVLLSAFTTLSGIVSGALALGFSGLLTTLTSVSGIMGIVGAAVSALLSPIGLLAVAVGALYLAWKKNLFGIRDIGVQVFSALKSLIAGDMTAAKNQFKRAVSMMGVSWRQNIQPLIASATQIFNRIKTVVGNAMRWLQTNAVAPALRGLTNLWRTHMGHIEEDTRQLRTFIKGVLTVIGGIIAGFAASAMVVWREFGDEILTVAKFAFDLLGSIIGGALDAIFTAIDIVTDLMVGDWKGALNAISGLATRIFNGIIGFARKWGGRFLSWVGGLVGDVIQWFIDLGNRLIHGSVVPEMLSAITTAFKNFISDIISKISQWVNDVVTWFGDLHFRANEKIRQLKNDTIRFIGELVSNVISTVSGWVNDFVSWAGDLHFRVNEKIRQLKNDVIGFVGDLISETISKATGWVSDFTQPFKDAAGTVMDKFAELKETVVGGSTVPDMLSELVSEAKGSWADKFIAPFASAAQSIMDKFAEMKDTAGGAAKGAAKALGGGGNYANRRHRQLVKSGTIGSGIDYGGLKNMFYNTAPKKTHSWGWDFVGEVMGEWGKASAKKAIRYMANHPNQRQELPGPDYFKMASGGIVSSPTPAIIGEGSEPEAVAPLSKLDSMLSGDSGSSGPETVVLQLDGEATKAVMRGEAVEVVNENEQSKTTRINAGVSDRTDLI